MGEPAWMEQVRAVNREFEVAGERIVAIHGPLFRQINEEFAAAIPRVASALAMEVARMKEAPGDH